MRRPLLLLLTVVAAASAAGSSTTTSSTTQSPREHRADHGEASNTEVVTKIVKKIKTMAEHHQLPVWLQQQIEPMASNLIHHHPDHIHFIKSLEPSLDTSVYSATGYHMQGMLGLVEYLILLYLLWIDVDAVAKRYRASIKKKEPLVRKARDLRGTAHIEELSRRILPKLHSP